MPFILNFHGIGAATTRDYEEGERPYWISVERFRMLLDTFAAPIRSGRMVLTFDDGNASDAEIAAPELIERGVSAMIFVLAGKLDRPGYLSSEQVRELDAKGFTIGSHGLDHRPWPSLGDDDLRAETAESRAILERILARPVTSAALPFGRYDGRVLRALRAADYKMVYSSDGAQRLTSASPIPRFSVRDDTDDRSIVERMNATAPIRRAAQELKIRMKAAR